MSCKPTRLRRSKPAPRRRGAPSAGAGRRVELSPHFDEKLYLALNPDVAEEVVQGRMASGAWHWVNHGAQEEREGKRPTLTHPQYQRASLKKIFDEPTAAEIANFSAEDYLKANIDVNIALNGRTEGALDHWIAHGRFEGRMRSLTEQVHRRSIDLSLLMEKSFGVNLFAPFAAQSGLGTAARGYLRALRAARIPVHLVNLDFHATGMRIAARDFDIKPPYRVNLLQVNADTLSQFFHLFHSDWFDNSYNISIWAWELNVLRPDWYNLFSMLDEVWTISRFNTEAVEVISPIPVLTINPVVDLPIAKTDHLDRSYFGLPNGYLFLTIFDVGSTLARKNPNAVIEAFIRAFDGRTDVFLVVKFHSAQHDHQSVEKLLKRIGQTQNIIVKCEILQQKDLFDFQLCADCLVSAHRAEGFGFNIAEFMLTGKPVIATGYSGNMDFTSPENSYLIPYSIKPLSAASGPYLPGYLWAEPDRESLASLMRHVVDAQAESKAKGALGAAAIRRQFSAEAIGARIASRFAVLELRHEVPAFMRSVGRSRTVTAPAPEAALPLADPAQIAACPTLSIIIPLQGINAGDLVVCIESIRKQTSPRWELCLCTDASADSAALEILKSVRGIDPRIRIKNLASKQNFAFIFDAAVTLASGGWLMLFESPGILAEDAVATIATALMQNPEIDAFYSEKDVRAPVHLLKGGCINQPTIVRTSLFLQVGGIKNDYGIANIDELMQRIYHLTKAVYPHPSVSDATGHEPSRSLAEPEHGPSPWDLLYGGR